jgi:hypothetical protein
MRKPIARVFSALPVFQFANSKFVIPSTSRDLLFRFACHTRLTRPPQKSPIFANPSTSDSPHTLSSDNTCHSQAAPERDLHGNRPVERRKILDTQRSCGNVL